VSRLGRVGIWSRELRNRDLSESRDAVAELEALGYGAIWMPGGSATDFYPRAEAFLSATHETVVAAGILSVWSNPAFAVAAAHVALAARFPDRVLLGLGVSHAHRVETETSHRYEHPVAVMNQYLDALAASEEAVPRDQVVLAALGPRMLEVARDRSVGAHPYFVDAVHTAHARFILGPNRLLAPEHAVVLETDPRRAREIARHYTSSYLTAPNYANNLRRLGFGDAELRDGGSDRVVDAVVAWGDVDTIERKVAKHFDAGADHVCIQVIPADPDRMPLAEWRALAPLARPG
jgi:probable F420-dependent oxidoreductase